MKKIYRMMLLILALLIFFTVSPLIVYYAMGYRLYKENGTERAGERVGVMIVETIPKRCYVTVDGKTVGRSPKSITDLRPKLTNVEISKEGYVSWQKTIEVKASEVSEIRDVRLFPAKADLKTLMSDVKSFSLSPNRDLLIVLNRSNQVTVMDTDGEIVIGPIALTYTPNSLLWSPDSNYFLIDGSSRIDLVDISDEKTTPVRVSVLESAKQYSWDQRIPGRLLLLDESDEMKAYHIASKAMQVLAENVQLFETSARHIYTLDLEHHLNIYNLQGELVDSLKFEEDKNIKKIMVTPGDQIALLFDDNRLSIMTNDQELQPVAENVQHVGWSPDGQLAYVQTDETSIYAYNVEDERLSYLPINELRLITRLSRPIRDPQWFAGGRHLIYQVDDEIIITEIDTRDHPISYTVDETNLGDSLATVGAHGDVLFYLKKTGENNRLVRANLVYSETKKGTKKE